MKKFDVFEPIPIGYNVVPLSGGESLLLPAAEADAFLDRWRIEEDKRQETKNSERAAKMDAAEKQAHAKRVREGVKESIADIFLSRDAVPTPAGMHRIFANMKQVAKGFEDANAGTSTPDVDFNRRKAAVCKQVGVAGPFRRFLTPCSWRGELDALEANLPHFKSPIAFIRQSLALAEMSIAPLRIPPVFLLGSPGTGKTHFSYRIAEILGVSRACISFDSPGSGTQLRGSESYWGNTKTGVLFNLICQGEFANPVILLDELDKAAYGRGRQIDPLAQLHAALEPETARRLTDVSVELDFDASLVTYIATGNSLRGIDGSILSRFEIFHIEPPTPREAVGLATMMAANLIARLGLLQIMSFSTRSIVVLAHLSPRLMKRTMEKAVACAVVDGRNEISEDDIYILIGLGEDQTHKKLH